MEVQVSLKGTREAIAQFTGSIEALKHELAEGLHTEAELVMTDSKANYCPVDTGILRSSGFVDPPEWTGNNQVVIQLGYGGPADAYALEQHENLTNVHTVGQAKYLETPLLKAAPDLDAHMAARIQTASI